VKLEAKNTDVVIAPDREDPGPSRTAEAIPHLGRGLEMAHQKRFTIGTGVQVYFYDPKSPW
jgi:hypothetical protein